MSKLAVVQQAECTVRFSNEAKWMKSLLWNFDGDYEATLGPNNCFLADI